MGTAAAYQGWQRAEHKLTTSFDGATIERYRYSPLDRSLGNPPC
jgi:hypothetical protein